MKKWVRQLALLIFGLSGVKLAMDGLWYQGLILWFVILIGVLLYEKRMIESQLSQVLPKLYVCAKPEEYSDWLNDLAKQLTLGGIFEEKLAIYRYSGWLYEMGRMHLPKKFEANPLQPIAKKGRFSDPAKQFEKLLLTPADQYRKFLNDCYRLWVEGPESMKVLSRNDLEQAMAERELGIADTDPQKSILQIIAQLLLAKWALSEGKRQEAETKLSALRETEVFNLMFGEVNYHLAEVSLMKKQWQKADYFKRVAINFADGTALEKLILENAEE